ncbi:hypothetical protein F0U62_21760 [Cystobacter fuscus]|uniref:hypothetical protein n=1 Tax=Cystobacter fuscus TaxID=43 RepID=UPI002B30870D|nr:hypothetical protein F0U62_21760 [Cystobacter fuscus]
MVLLRIVWVVVGAWVGVQLMILVCMLLPRQVERDLMQAGLSWGKDIIPAIAVLWLLSATAGAFFFTWLWRRRFMRRAS